MIFALNILLLTLSQKWQNRVNVWMCVWVSNVHGDIVLM